MQINLLAWDINTEDTLIHYYIDIYSEFHGFSNIKCLLINNWNKLNKASDISNTSSFPRNKWNTEGILTINKSHTYIAMPYNTVPLHEVNTEVII